jgi:hypothetical protein
MFFGLAYYANPWVVKAGPAEIMYVFGGTSIFLCFLGLPVYIYGKRLRSWWARHNVFVLLNMHKTATVSERA